MEHLSNTALLDKTGRWTEEYLHSDTLYMVADLTGDGLPSPAVAVKLLYPNGSVKIVHIHVHTLDRFIIQ